MQEQQHDQWAEFRVETPAQGEGDLLQRISKKARELLAAQLAVEKAEEALKEAQALLGRIEEMELPALMEEAEQKKLTTSDGILVEIREVVRASIPKDRQHEAIAWLESNNYGSIVKHRIQILFGRDEDAWASKFLADCRKRKRQLNLERKDWVEPMTLQAQIREMLADGVAVPMDLFGAFQQRYAKIKVAADKPSTPFD